MESRELMTELIPNLPDELGLECLTRLPYTAHRYASSVCRRWRLLLQSPDFYNHRQHLGHTRKVACLVQQLPTGDRKPIGQPSYGIAVFEPDTKDWYRLDPVPKYPDGLPLFCQVASCDSKLVVVGGWEPASYEPVADVFVYDFTTGRWRQGAAMPCKRSFFAIGALEGRVYVAGGHDENKNALRSAWAYEVARDEWVELTQMSQERDECAGVVVGRCFWVVSGYRTESPGEFETSAESYGVETGEWSRIEGVWGASQCPSSRVGAGKDGRLFNWAESGSAVRAGACGVSVGERTLVMGSEYQGGPHGFYMVHGPDGKFERVNAPDGFSGFVRSGCCVEI